MVVPISKLSQGTINSDSYFAIGGAFAYIFWFQGNEAGKGCAITPVALKLTFSQSHLRNTPGPVDSYSALSAFRCEDFWPPELKRLSSDLFSVLHGQMGNHPSRHPVTEPVIAEILLYHDPL